VTILINIDVPSLAEGERFYVSAFGLKPGRKLGDTVLEMTGWPVLAYLLEKPAGTIGAALKEREYTRHWTPVHVDVVVPDLDHAVELAMAAGAVVEGGPADTSYGRIAMLADPFGHGFCLIEFNSSGYDSVLST